MHLKKKYVCAHKSPNKTKQNKTKQNQKHNPTAKSILETTGSKKRREKKTEPLFLRHYSPEEKSITRRQGKNARISEIKKLKNRKKGEKKMSDFMAARAVGVAVPEAKAQ